MIQQLVSYSCTIVNIVVLIWLVLHAQHMPDTMSRKIVHDRALVYLLLLPSWIMMSLRASGVEVAWWVHTLTALITQTAIIVAYFAVLQGQTHQRLSLSTVWNHPLILGAGSLSLILILSDYTRRYNYVSILDSTTSTHSWTFAISELCYTFVLIYSGYFLLRLYRQVLQGVTDPIAFSRTAVAAYACALGMGYILLLIISTLATLIVPMYDGVLIRWLTYEVGWPIVFFSFLGGTFGFQKVHTRLEHYSATWWHQHQSKQRALLRYLHASIVQIVPSAHVPVPLASNDDLLDLLIEVSDARRMVWSYIANNGQLIARTEAYEIIKLSQQRKVLIKAGPYKPPSLASKTIAYNLAVARELEQLERIQKHEFS